MATIQRHKMLQIIRHYSDCPKQAKGGVIALGNFDGVHLGHKAVLQKTKDIARELNAPSLVMTFEPHPVRFFNPNAAPFRITPFRNKMQLLNHLDIDYAFPLAFNREFSLIKANEFVEDILVNTLNIQHIIVGYDFIFGRNRVGNAQLLRDMSQSHNFDLTQIDVISNGDVFFSSTKIREYLKGGNICEAEKLLGHNYIIEGRVRIGQQNGRKIGTPTANIRLKDYIRPALGVYAAETMIETDDEWLPSIVNIGNRPTFGAGEDLLETHIFNFDKDIYGKRIKVRLLRYIRGEIKFNNIDELKNQIKKDCEIVSFEEIL